MNSNITNNQFKKLKLKRHKSNWPKMRRSWTKNWGGKGIAILDRMERISTSSGDPILVGEPSYREKLNRLMETYPNSRFFKSLGHQVNRTKWLSVKQRQAIDRSYFSVAATYQEVSDVAPETGK